MADSPDYLPLAEPPPDDQALLARAFWLLLDHGRPVEVDVLAGALQREPTTAADWSNRPPVRCGRSGRDPPRPAPVPHRHPGHGPGARPGMRV
jgi:hypothetical protein